jgi:hypothetical protein
MAVVAASAVDDVAREKRTASWVARRMASLESDQDIGNPDDYWRGGATMVDVDGRRWL